MAKDKKCVLLYCDIIYTVEELDDSDAGLLFKHFLRYVNDQNPEPPSKLIKIVFEPIKQTLKRDLRKWEAISNRNKSNANKRWHPNNATASDRIRPNTRNADRDIVIDIVKDKVIDKDIDSKYMRPRDFLKQINEIEFQELEYKSRVSDFESCIEQWSLAVEGGEFKYTGNNSEDYRKLKAQFQKWSNTWRQNESKYNNRKGKTTAMELLEICKKAQDGISYDN